jgi:Fe2+ transport system protein FeoA
MTLDELTAGQMARITEIGGEGPFAQRLMALGLLEGTDISLTRKAIGGDPIEIEIMGYRLSLRRDEARQIKVTPTDG